MVAVVGRTVQPGPAWFLLSQPLCAPLYIVVSDDGENDTATDGLRIRSRLVPRVSLSASGVHFSALALGACIPPSL